jgi:hypothetical protein
VEVRWIVLSSGIYKNGNRTPLRNLRHTFLDYLLAGKINTSFQNSLHFIVERCRSLSPHMPTRTSALRHIGRVIILNDPFFSRPPARRPQAESSGVRRGAWSSRPFRLLVLFCGFLPCRRGRRRSGLKILRRS